MGTTSGSGCDPGTVVRVGVGIINQLKEGDMDKYDVAVEYLMGCNGNFEKEAENAWRSPRSHQAGCLFLMVKNYEPKNIGAYGCLTMIKNGMFQAQTQELTDAIRADGRLPENPAFLTRDHLPIFADWQRHIDQVLQRA